MITDEMLKEAMDVIKLHHEQEIRMAVAKAMPIVEEGLILEYQDLTGCWYEYDDYHRKYLLFVPPRGTRVRRKSKPETIF